MRGRAVAMQLSAALGPRLVVDRQVAVEGEGRVQQGVAQLVGGRGC